MDNNRGKFHTDHDEDQTTLYISIANMREGQDQCKSYEHGLTSVAPKENVNQASKPIHNGIEIIV